MIAASAQNIAAPAISVDTPRQLSGDRPVVTCGTVFMRSGSEFLANCQLKRLSEGCHNTVGGRLRPAKCDCLRRSAHALELSISPTER